MRVAIAVLASLGTLTQQHQDPGAGSPTPPSMRAIAVGMLTDNLAWAIDHDGRVRTVNAQTAGVASTRVLPAAMRGAGSGGGRLVVSVEGGRALVFEGRALQQVGEFEAGERVLVARDGEAALTFGSGLAGPRVHRLPDGELLRKIDIPGCRLRRVAWDERGDVVAAIDVTGQPHAWNSTGTLTLSPGSSVSAVAVDPKGRFVAIGDEAEGGETPTVRVLSARTGEELAGLVWPDWDWPFEAGVRHLAFDPAGEHLVATTGDYGAVQAWKSTESGWMLAWVHDYRGGNPGSQLHLAIDASSEHLWVWGSDAAAFEISSGRRWVAFQENGRSNVWKCFGPSPDGRTIAALRFDELVLLESDGRPRFGPPH